MNESYLRSINKFWVILHVINYSFMYQWNFIFQKYESIEVCQKSVVQLHLTKSPGETEFGFTVEAELAEDFDKDDELRLYVSQVTPGSVAHRSREFVESLLSLKRLEGDNVGSCSHL